MHWSMVQTKARRPSLGRSSSMALSLASTRGTWWSSTMEITAEAIDGQAWEPKWGSPVWEPRPCTCSQAVKPRQLERSSTSMILA